MKTSDTNLITELQKIALSAGRLTPAIVVQAAASPDHPLHHCFCWDDTIAARKWREEQAAQLIRRVKVTVIAADQREVTVRAFINVRDTDADTAGKYVSIEDAMRHPDYHAQLMEQAQRDLQSFRQKYASLTELSAVFCAIDAITQPKSKAA